MKTKKYKEVLSLYEKTSTEVSKSPKDWLTFLDSACNNYKLRFDEQLLIYAQRPDATAVLELNRWNRNFGRWVKSGTKGIAVFGDAPKGNGTLKYYFDISDTRETDHSRKVTIWEIQPEYNNNIIKSLENSFGYLSEKSNIFDAVISAVKNISENILANNTQRQLIYATENSLLEELSDDIVIAQYTELVRNSAAYMTAKRLRLDTNERFFQDDFVNIINFNTKKTLEILGIAVNQVSKSLLSIIAKTMNNLYSIERSFYNDRREQTITENNLRREVRPLVHIGRENADISSESYSAGTAGSTDRTVRKNESEVPERKSRGNILYSPDELQAKRAFDGNRADSDRDGGTPDERNGSFRGSNGEAESGGYDELGTQNEQHQKPSSGNRDERSNLRLEYYDRNHEDKSLPFFGNDDTVREILATTPHLKATKDEIRAFFENEADDDRRIEYIKGIFNNDYTEVILSDGRQVGYKTFQNVLQLWEGSYLSRTKQSFYDWRIIADHFEAMRLLGELQNTNTFKPLPSTNGQMSLILDYEAEVTKPSAFSFSQGIIDAVLCRGSGVSEGKFRIYEQFQKSLSKKENVEFLKNEYGWGGSYPIIVGTGIDEQHDVKGITLSKGIGNDKPHIVLNWNQVEKRIGELIKLNRYLNPKEAKYYPQWLEKQELSRTETTEQHRKQETLSTAPTEREKAEPSNEAYEYRNGNKVYIGADEYEILSFDNDRVMLYDTQFPLFNKEMSRSDFDQIIQENPMNDHLKVKALPTEENRTAAANTTPIGNDDYYFHRPDVGEFEAVYYNPDAAAGGQFVFMHLPYELIADAKEKTSGVDEFYEYLDEHAQTELVDLGTPEYNEVLKEYAEPHPDRIGRTQDTMDTLVSQAESEKTQDITLPEFYRDFLQIKTDNPNSLVLYQFGDFFEAYGEDAQKIADALELMLTSRSVSDSQKIPMVGFPQRRLEIYMNMLTDRGYDLTVSAINGDDRKVFSIVSTNKEDPVESEPIGRIDYLHTDGTVRESVEYTSPYQFEKDIKEENSYDVPMKVFLYKDRDGNTIPSDFLSSVGVQGVEIINSPYLETASEKVEKTSEPVAPVLQQPKKSRVHSFDLHPEIPMSDRSNFNLKENPVEEVGKKERFRRNMEAIRVLKQCREEKRYATSDEQLILSKYVGWGGLADCFDERHSHYAELKNRLSPDEYAAARESTLTAFYTPPTVIKAVYKALEQLGFREGNILEPSCGIGHFIGMLPDSMKESRIYGVELDSISAGIAQQLYQKTSIAAQPFEEANLPDSFFDAVVGNVPFGDFKVSDKRYDKHKFLIHDYFFAKSLDKLRPGGVMALITSKGTMDKENPAVRKYIAQRADLLGAVRLPNNTFKGNAGTEVVSDILILQKRDRIVDIEPDWVHLAKDENGITMNSYFVEHPEMILGEMKMVSGRFGPESSCIPYEGADLEELLDDAIANIHGEITSYEVEELTEEDNSIPADPTVRNFSYTLVDGRVYFRENSRMAPVDVSATAENRIKGMITIRDCVRNLIELQTEDYPDAEIKAEQGRLNKLYDIFTEKYGLINSRANTSAFSQDSSFSLLSALEVLDDEGNLERKADMFFKCTIKPHTPVTSVDTASEALAVSMGEKACIDMDYMCQLSGKTEEEIFADLKGVIFLNPMYGYGNSTEAKYLMADEYLSGNVREKLAVAKKSAQLAPEDYTINVEALQKVQPKDLTASEISVRLGATWLPPEIVKQFMFEFLGTPGYARYNIKLHFFEFTGEWSIEGKTNDKGNVKAYSTYGTSRINAYKIIEETLNLKDVRIFDYVEDEEGKKKAILNKKETAIAQSKQELIKQGFQDWIWSKPERREKLCKLYNEKFNSIRPREYDGSHITFNGMNPEIELREHQKNAVAHILYGGNTLLAHAVGAGKTYEMTAAAMESKRLGLCSKSLFVVPNHLTEQWAAEFLQLYPAANILVATKKDFETKNRKRFCGRIATGDYDAIIIGHSQFEKIPMSIERQRAILEQQLDEVTAGIADLKKSRGDNFSIKQLERTKKSVKQKLDKLNDQSRKDDVVTFEELGVDRIFIDESHYYKNLFLYTKMRNVGGIAQTEAQKSSDLFMKCRYLDEITGGRGTVFATGTPISNSMVELYTIQRYLQYNTLVKNNLQHFDAWASTFGETVSAVELTPEGTGYRSKTRFARFFNLPELMAMFKEVADIKTADTLNLPVPKANFHNISVKPSDIQKEIVASLAERADEVRNDMVDASVDNMLKITNDGRKLALDQRLINPMLPDFENSKINACVDNIYRIWEETGDKKSAQLVFCDLSTPKNDGKFSVYDDIRKKLIERGIPAEEIKFIHEADTEAKKLELFKKVRRGDVRVLMGSTQKMGAGTNVQNKLIALHDIDCPWRPSDLEQRSGRIIRQGNENAEVNIYRYVTEQTFDAYLYQLVEGKQKFASQIMTSKSPVRSCEDIDETALSYAEIKMLATGNPYIKEKMDLDIQVQKLRLLKSNFLSEKYALEDKIIKFYPQEIARLKQRITALENDIITVNNNVVQEKDAFSPMTLEGIDYTKKAVAGQMLLTACKEHAFEEPTEIGSYRGFRMEVSYSILTSEYRLDLCGNLRHQVTLGTDIFGNITRIDNELAKIPAKLEAAKHVLTETLEQYDYAKEQVKKPFASEDDLQKKTNRLNELNAFLNIEKAAPKSNSSSDGIEYKFRKCSEAEKDILVDNGFSDYRYSDSDNKYIFRYPAEQEMKINAALNIRQNNIKI